MLMNLATILYKDEDDARTAVEFAPTFIATGLRGPAQGSEAASLGSSVPLLTLQVNQPFSEKVTHNVAMRLRDIEKKFARKLGQCSI